MYMNESSLTLVDNTAVAGFDGNPEYFFSQDFKIKGPHWENEIYGYDNDQPAGTLWYHDHALGKCLSCVIIGSVRFFISNYSPHASLDYSAGITRLNVYSGLAGFYIL